MRSTSGDSTGRAGLGVDLRAGDDGCVAELFDARRRFRATRTGAGARIVGGGRLHRSESTQNGRRTNECSANELEQQHESCDEPQESDDRGDCDGCSEHEEQRDDSDGESDDENREDDDRDECEAEGDHAERRRSDKMADESKHADRRRVSRRSRFEYRTGHGTSCYSVYSFDDR